MATRRRAQGSRTPRRRSARTPVERLRAICLTLPETTEKIAWSEPTWRVKGKLFAQLDNHHHGADHLAVWLPAPLGEQESMVYLDPVRFFRPPYVGQRGWVGVRIDRRPDWALVATLVKQAYREVAPPRLREAVAAAAPRVLKRRRD
jgi:predicted DNA-binding protein (MmcQ/YjbR family)